VYSLYSTTNSIISSKNSGPIVLVSISFSLYSSAPLVMKTSEHQVGKWAQQTLTNIDDEGIALYTRNGMLLCLRVKIKS